MNIDREDNKQALTINRNVLGRFKCLYVKGTNADKVNAGIITNREIKSSLHVNEPPISEI
jgi:hypothetical protein